DSERKSAAQLDDRRDAPAVDKPACDPILARVEIRLEVQAHAEDVSLVRIACALIFRKVAIVLSQSLSRAVVKLYTAKGLAKGVEGVKRNVVVHPHGGSQLQPMVIGTLVRLKEQYGTEQRVGPPCKYVRSGTRGSRCQDRVIDVTSKRQGARPPSHIRRSDD